MQRRRPWIQLWFDELAKDVKVRVEVQASGHALLWVWSALLDLVEEGEGEASADLVTLAVMALVTVDQARYYLTLFAQWGWVKVEEPLGEEPQAVAVEALEAKRQVALYVPNWKVRHGIAARDRQRRHREKARTEPAQQGGGTQGGLFGPEFPRGGPGGHPEPQEAGKGPFRPSSAPPPPPPAPAQAAKPDPKVAAHLESARRVFDYWREVLHHPRAQFPADPKDLARRRLLEAVANLGEEACRSVIRGAKADPWPGRKNQDTLDLLFRDSGHVAKFQALDPEAPESSDRLVAETPGPALAPTFPLARAAMARSAQDARLAAVERDEVRRTRAGAM